jgi:hemolysin III
MDTAMKTSHIKEPGSALTHFIGLCLTLVGTVPLLQKTLQMNNRLHFISMVIFLASMLLLYAASTLCHSLDAGEEINLRLRKLDHVSIYILIAGTYTPVCLLSLCGAQGDLLCICVWTLAIGGCAAYLLWADCPKWVSSALYIAMGWLIIFKLPALLHVMSPEAVLLLFAGGVLYTIGGIIYALKLPRFNSRHPYFGSHEVFHLFVMGGSFCHYLMMYLFLARMPLA